MGIPQYEIPRVFRIVVAGVVVREDRLLLLQRCRDEEIYPEMWELPSGRREPNETCLGAIEREMEEETGLSIVVERPFSVFDYVVETPAEVRDTTQINFLVRLSNPQQELQLSREHQDARWFTADELRSLQHISEETRKCALAALENY